MRWTLRLKLTGLAYFEAVMLLITSLVGILGSVQASQRKDRRYDSHVMGMTALGNVRWHVAPVPTAAILSVVATCDQLADLTQREASLAKDQAGPTSMSSPARSRNCTTPWRPG